MRDARNLPSDMDILRKLLRQFWLPFLVALGWTGSVLWNHADRWTLTHVLAAFAPSFFLASWAVGQFFRVKNQSQVERNLSNIEMRVGELLGRLEESTQELTANITGGESACYVYITPMHGPNPGAPLMAVHVGAHPIFDVQIRVCDLDALHALQQEGGLTLHRMHEIERYYRVNSLTPGHSVDLGGVPLTQTDRHRFNMFMSARNGSYSQLFRAYRSNDEWKVGYQIQAHGKVIHESYNPPTFRDELHQTDGDFQASANVPRLAVVP